MKRIEGVHFNVKEDNMPETIELLTIQQAAEKAGVSASAVRKRVKEGQVELGPKQGRNIMIIASSLDGIEWTSRELAMGSKAEAGEISEKPRKRLSKWERYIKDVEEAISPDGDQGKEAQLQVIDEEIKKAGKDPKQLLILEFQKQEILSGKATGRRGKTPEQKLDAIAARIKKDKQIDEKGKNRIIDYIQQIKEKLT